MRISGNVCNSYVHMDLIVTEKSTNVANNTSTVEWQLVGWLGTSNSAYWYSNNYHSISVTINGTTVYSLANTTQKSISIGTNHTQASPLVIASGSTTVNHNSDGSKTCSASFSCVYRYNSSFTWSGRGQLTLTTIPRASSFSVSGNTIGSDVKFTINRASTSFTHRLRYSLTNGTKSESGTIASSVGSSYTWKMPSDFANYVPNSTSLSGLTLYVDTYNGSTLIGTKSLSVTIYIPSTMKPKITALSNTPFSYNSTINGWGEYICGYSRNKCTITAEGSYGSSITKYEISDGAETVSGSDKTQTSPLLKNITNKLTVTVTDSRGRTASVVTTITTISYSKPYLKNIECFRCDSSGNEIGNGKYIYIKASSIYKTCNGHNQATIKYAVYKKSDYSSVTSGTLTSDTGKIVSGLSETTTYIVVLNIKDSVGSDESYEYVIPTKTIAVNFFPSKKGGAAFGKYAEKEETLDIGEWTFEGGYGYFNYDVVANSGDNPISLGKIGDLLLVSGGKLPAPLTFENVATFNNTVVINSSIRIANGKALYLYDSEGNYRSGMSLTADNYYYIAVGAMDNKIFIGSLTGTTEINIRAKSTAGCNVYMHANSFCPPTNGTRTLGNATYKWASVYATNGTIQTSDKNKKKDIEPLSDKYIQFFSRLLPKSFKFNDGTSGRTHIGFISQDVEEALYDSGLTDLEFGGFCKDVRKKKIQIKEEELNEDGEVIHEAEYMHIDDLDENGNIQYDYSLRYDEFIAINVAVTQKMKNEIEGLKKELNELKELVQQLVQ